jgi:hypothetical protein
VPPPDACWRRGVIRSPFSTSRRRARGDWRSRFLPSTHKLLAEIGLLDAVERGGFSARPRQHGVVGVG